jgi:pimeloyl-ACP methyl ester carboxylesterase
MNVLNTFIACLAVVLMVPAYSHCSSGPSASHQEGMAYISHDTVLISSDGTSIRAETGTIIVPENRRREGSRLIPIDYIRLKSLSEIPGVPLFYLEGGGDPSTWQAGDPDRLGSWLPFLEVSDVILFDQRGSKDQQLLWVYMAGYHQQFLVSEQEATRHLRMMAEGALPAFEERGVDITGYTVVEQARDIDDLRKHLAIERYAILGSSFGSQIGMMLITLYEQRIATAVFAGTEGLADSFNYPSDLDTQVERIASMVARDGQLHAMIPDFSELLDQVMDGLGENPVRLQVINPLTRQSMEVDVGPFGLALILRLDIDDATDIPIIPKMLFTLNQGDTRILQEFVQKRIVLAFALSGNGLTQGLASGVSDQRLEEIEREARESAFGNVVNFPYAPLIPIWPSINPEIDFTTPVTSNIRTLFLSGDLDARTPIYQTEEIRKGFPNSVHIVVTNAGHEQVLPNREVREIIQSFLMGDVPVRQEVTSEPVKFVW